MNKLEVLEKSDLFGGLDNEQLSLVAELCTSEVFESGETICKQGKKLDKLYIIEDGLAGVFLELGPTTRRQIRASSRFETFGWSALLPSRRSGTTSVALERTKVLACDGQELVNLCRSNHDICFKVQGGLLQVVLGRLDNAYVQLMGVTCEV